VFDLFYDFVIYTVDIIIVCNCRIFLIGRDEMFFKKNINHIKQRKSFDKYMDMSNSVASDKAALRRLIRLLGRHPRDIWKQDSNHKVWYWHPVGVGLVHNGYHSIAYGIIDGVGEVCCHHAFDLSAAYDFIKADGVHFIRLQDNKPVWQVHSPELAAIFEIGRMLV
jgi:hypothetical protein